MKFIVKLTLLVTLLVNSTGCVNNLNGTGFYGSTIHYALWNQSTSAQKAGAVMLGILTLGIEPLIECIGMCWFTVPLGTLSRAASSSSSTFDIGNEYLKDLEKLGAYSENDLLENAGNNLSLRLGLSEERGLEIAKISYHLYKIGNTRSITKGEYNRYVNSVLGVSLEGLNNINEKNQDELDSLMNKVALKNKTDPEHIKDLIIDLLQK